MKILERFRKKYRYLVSYAVNCDDKRGFGYTVVTRYKKIKTYDDLTEVSKAIILYDNMPDDTSIVIINYKLMEVGR